MSYELKICDLNGIWHTADLGSDLPSMNYQSIDVNDIQNRRASYSQNIKLPRSLNNRKIFFGADEPGSGSIVPYRKLKCWLYCNESPLVQSESYIILTKVSTSFECQILSGIVDIFDTMKNMPMSDIDLGYIMRNQASLTPSNWGTYWMYGVATFGDVTSFPSTLAHIYPFVKFKQSIEKIISDLGYTFETTLNESYWDNYLLSIAEMQLGSDSLDYYKGAVSYSQIHPASNSILLVNVGNNANGQITTSLMSGVTWIKYKPVIDSRVRVDIAYTPDSSVTNTAKIKVEFLEYSSTESSGFTIIDTVYLDTSTTSTQCELDVPASGSEFLGVWITVQVGSLGFDLGLFSLNASFTLSTEEVPVNGKLYISNNLGFDNVFDFFKMFVNLFCLIPIIDYDNKILKCYTFGSIRQNKSKLIDWSSKLHRYNIEETFLYGSYAQKNYIKLEENSTDNIELSAVIIIDNEALDKEKDLFTLPIESGKDNIINSYQAANIPLESDNEFEGGKIHLLKNTSQTMDILIDGNTYTYDMIQHVQPEEIETYYGYLQSVINRAEYYEAYFKLTDSDIEIFNQMDPVYISQLSGWFFVSKINNYVSGKLTKVNLLKII